MEKSLAEKLVKSADSTLREEANRICLEGNLYLFGLNPLKALIYDQFDKTVYWVEEIANNELICSCKKGLEICRHKVTVAWSVLLEGKPLKPKSGLEKFFYLAQALCPSTKLIARFVEISEGKGSY